MADLAKLVVRLEAQSAQLLTELEKANGRIAKFERNASGSLDRLNKSFDKFGFGVKAAFAAFATGITIKALVDANVAASKSFANLENAVERAGDAAGGRSAQDFAASAKQIANLSTETGGAVQGVQQLLLRFQNIRTDRFDEATKRVLDLSVALGKDLQSSAELVGKALADPIKGVTQLAKAGVNFSDGQQAVIKNLVETGRRAEAQGIILDKLQEKFAGAAEKARNNFGGALTAVHNALGDLMESSDGLPAATGALNELATVLQDPAVKQGADQLFAIIITGAAKAANFVGQVAAGLGVLFNKTGDRVEELSKSIDFLESERKSLVPLVLTFGDKSDVNPTGGLGVLTPADIDAQIKKLRDEQDAILGLGVAGIETAKHTKAAFGDISKAFELPDIEVVDGMTAAEKRLQDAAMKAGKSLTESLQTPFEKMQAEIKKADDLLKVNAITFETWQRAVKKAAADLDPLLAAIANLNGEVSDLGEGLRQKLITEDAGLSSDIEKTANDSTDAEFDKLDKKTKDAAHAAEVVFDQLSRNTQDILANGIEDALHDGFSKGAEGALDAFGNMLEKMAIQAIAADITSKIFGGGPNAAGGTGGSGAFGAVIDKVGGFLSNFFGGTRDSGGRGRKGEAVMIGRGAQPEMFVPDGPGEFFPKGSWPGGGGGHVTQNIYTSSPITQRSARQLALESARQQRVATARLG